MMNIIKQHSLLLITVTGPLNRRFLFKAQPFLEHVENSINM